MAKVKFPVCDVINYSEKCVKVGLEGNSFEHLDYFFLPKKLTTPYGYIHEDGTKEITDIEIPYWLAKENGLLAKNWDGSKVYNHVIYSE